MNTVLDDNKMLCLANSERIKLTNSMRMLFEVQVKNYLANCKLSVYVEKQNKLVSLLEPN